MPPDDEVAVVLAVSDVEAVAMLPTLELELDEDICEPVLAFPAELALDEESRFRSNSAV